MTTSISGTSGITFPAGGLGNPAGAVVGTTDTQTLTNKTLTSPTITGASLSSMASSVITSGTVQATTSGTGPFPFTGIPAWAKRITVQFSGVSANASNLLVQIGSGSYTSSGYVSAGVSAGASNSQISTAIGFWGSVTLSTGTNSGIIVLTNITGNTWVGTATASRSDGFTLVTSGYLALGGVLDRLQITTISGTATFSAGQVNIQYE